MSKDEGHNEVKQHPTDALGAPADVSSAGEHSFDQLAKEIANGAMTRKRVLKVAGISLLGSMSLGLIPGVADARKKKKKKCPKPPTCGRGISTGCFQCGTPTIAGEFCFCVPGVDGTPQCVNAFQGTFTPCTTNANCSGGQLCVDATSCSGSKVCVSPCT